MADTKTNNPPTTFYFYDLETSGVNPKTARIMQFAGQRTDKDINPIGEPHDFLIKLTEDVLPEPDAVLVTGITPQHTLAEGIREAEFLEQFHRDIATPSTIFVGFNSIRFDDEFMRYTHYRNFYDPYEWQWKDGRSRWDLLDVVRMTRALRPEGISWPFDSSGKPTNRLELLTSVNKLDHNNAHNALSDVRATISVAKLIKEMQPKLFNFLLELRDKKKVQAFVEQAELFVYTSGKYPSEQEKTTIVTTLAKTSDSSVLVYDLTVDPKQYMSLSVEEIIAAWQRRWNEDGPRLPVKTLKFNRCPAIAPLNVLDKKSQERLGISVQLAITHKKVLDNSDFAKRCLEALGHMDKMRNMQQSEMISNQNIVDEQLYNDFVPSQDAGAMRRLRVATNDNIHEILPQDFTDQRLQQLLLLYKARNFSKTLTEQEQLDWETFRRQVLLGGGESSRLARYMRRLKELDAITVDPKKRYLLEELQLYAESIVPESEVY